MSAPRWVKPGARRHIGRIETLATASPDKLPSGAPNTYWATHIARVSAEIDDLRGRELYAAQEHHSEITTRIRLRYRAGIVAETMRFVHRGVVYPILVVLEPLHLKRDQELLCKSGVREV